MLYLIGLGLNKHGISEEGLIALRHCHKIYLENYTIDLPYELKGFEKLNKRIISIDRSDVEGNRLIKEALSKKIALLVYGDPLFATTHISLILDAREQGVFIKVIHSASIFDAIAETGLQQYKFGKIASMPAWTDKHKPDSFIDVVKENQSIKAHSLVLVDIGLRVIDALHELKIASKNRKIKLEKIILCSRLGNEDSKVFYNNLDSLMALFEKEKESKINHPFCIIIPSELHFLEEQALKIISS